MSLVEIESEGAIISITLNRPDKHNALSPDMLRALLDAFAAVEEEKNRRAVLISGHGRSLSSGADRKAVAQLSGGDEIRGYAQLMRDTLSAIRNCAVPVVASVHGYALGAGCGIVTVCDIAVAAPDSVFGFPEIRHGILPALVVPGLVERIGPNRAFPLLATGRDIDAAEAFAIGLISEIAKDDPSIRAREIALRLADAPAGHIEKLRELVRSSSEDGFDSAIETARKHNIDARLEAAGKSV